MSLQRGLVEFLLGQFHSRGSAFRISCSLGTKPELRAQGGLESGAAFL